MSQGRDRISFTEDAKLISLFSGMMSRCYNPKASGYYNYGGRGISICDEWMADRNKFYLWAVTNGYNAGLQIDRIDVDKHYAPDNCRFVTAKQNCRNKRETIYSSFSATKTPLCEIVENEGLDYSRVLDKMKRGLTDKESIEFFKYKLLNRAESLRNKKSNKIAELKKIIDENFCFMQFKG